MLATVGVVVFALVIVHLPRVVSHKQGVVVREGFDGGIEFTSLPEINRVLQRLSCPLGTLFSLQREASRPFPPSLNRFSATLHATSQTFPLAIPCITHHALQGRARSKVAACVARMSSCA